MVNKKNPALTNKQLIDPGDSFSAHKMNSEGDVKTCIIPENFDQFLDHYENNVLLNQSNNAVDEVTLKEFAKFMKPKVSVVMVCLSFFLMIARLVQVPSSVKLRQEQSLKPQMKLSLDKLLNRLQKCENLDQSDGESASHVKVDKESVDKASKV